LQKVDGSWLGGRNAQLKGRFEDVQSIEPGKEWEFKVLLLDPDAVGYEPILPVDGYR